MGTETTSQLKYVGDYNPDGVSFGRSSTDKISFYGATPVDKPASTEDLKDILVAYGLMTTGGATPLNLDAGAFTCGAVSCSTIAASGNITAADAISIIAGTSTGLKIGTATSQKIGFFNATPVSQSTLGSAVTSTGAVSTTTGAITSWGFSTAAQANAIVTLVNQVRGLLVALGFSA